MLEDKEIESTNQDRQTTFEFVDAPSIGLFSPSARPRTPKPRIVEVSEDAENLGPQQPFTHQVESENFLRRAGRGLLVDDMGIGKTLPALKASEGRTVVICPATLKSNWAREIGQKRPGEKIVILQSRTPEPIPEDARWAIINFEVTEAWADTIVRWRPFTAIVDEAHTLRETRTAMFPACKTIVWSARRRYLLTGTQWSTGPKI